LQILVHKFRFLIGFFGRKPDLGNAEHNRFDRFGTESGIFQIINGGFGKTGAVVSNQDFEIFTHSY
jgi:hypothetical protein